MPKLEKVAKDPTEVLEIVYDYTLEKTNEIVYDYTLEKTNGVVPEFHTIHLSLYRARAKNFRKLLIILEKWNFPKG